MNHRRPYDHTSKGDTGGSESEKETTAEFRVTDLQSLKMKEGATSREKQEASGSWRR